MWKGKNTTLIFILSIISIYGAFAIIETIKLSSKTVDEAFETFVNNEFQTEAARNDIGDKEILRIGNYAFVPFEVGDHVSFVHFEKGLFGWKRRSYTRKPNDGYSYAGSYDEINEEIVLHGVLPKDAGTEIRTIKVNGNVADIVKLNDKDRVWIYMNNQDVNFNSLRIKFFDEVGNVVREI